MLVERESDLCTLRALLEGTLAGRGALIFIGGEAGIGKTSLIETLVRESSGRVAVRRGYADNIPTAEALGALVDAVPELGEALDGGQTRSVIFRRLTALLVAEPALLVLEDLHWADEATFDMLRRVGRRITGLPIMIVVTYRDDEVGPRHPLSIVMGELATLPAVTRLSLGPLTIDGVQQLIDAAAVEVDAQHLHARTGGNAFFVTESLAADNALRDVPATVRDAVLARVAGLSAAARQVVDAAAILSPSCSVSLLTAVSGCSRLDVDECVRQGVLVASAEGVSFRHDLARLAVEESIPPGEATALHAAALHELAIVDPSDHRALAHHAASCGDWRALLEHAPVAAARAARLGAHRQAAEQYRMALRVTQLETTRRAELHEQLSYECYVTEQTEEALVARQQAMELFELVGDVERVGAAQRWLSRFSWFLGRNADAERYAARAITTLESLGTGHELAMAYSNMSQLRALAHDSADAVAWGERALALARQIDDREVQIHALNNVGTAMRMLGRTAEGRQRLNRSLELALAEDAHEHAARAYTNLGYSTYGTRELAAAEQTLRAGIAYCEERDLDSWTRYMGATLVAVLTEQGRYDDAVAIAEPLLAHPQLAPISLIPAAAARARIAVFRGAAVPATFGAAQTAASATNESQRLLPIATACAEAAWIAGNIDDIAAGVDIAWDIAVHHPEPWGLGELCWWLDRGGVRRDPPIPVAEPFALMLSARWREAAEQWRLLGSPLWTALSLANEPDLDAAREAIDIVDSLGATTVHTAILRTRRLAGLPVPRGPRASSRGNTAQLTARELEVLQLLAQGLSNADVAERLFLSERTVAHHVSAILRKLGESSRGRAVAAARQHGIVLET